MIRVALINRSQHADVQKKLENKNVRISNKNNIDAKTYIMKHMLSIFLLFSFKKKKKEKSDHGVHADSILR